MSKAQQMTPRQQAAFTGRFSRLAEPYGCEHGHLECSERPGGPCYAEVLALIEERRESRKKISRSLLTRNNTLI